MPPRYSYWTILAGGLPTAFRAADREELEPTFRRLREKHPDAEMKWFARGKLWDSPAAAQAERRPAHDRGAAPRRETSRGEGARGRDWRPGGEHRDPRQPYKDARKARNIARRQEKFAHKQRGADWRDRERAPREKPHGDPRARFDAPGGSARFPKPGGHTRFEKPGGRFQKPGGARFDRPGGGARNDWRNRPPQAKAQGKGDWRDRPPRGKPHGDALGPRPPRRFEGGTGFSRARPETRQEAQRETRPRQERRFSPKGGWPGPPREKPHGDALAPRGTGGRDNRKPGARPRQDWRDTAPREKPQGDPITGGRRPFDRKGFPRGQRVDEPPPSRPAGPNREPSPGESPRPSPPPRPSEPAIPPPGPPERGTPPRGKPPRR